MKRVTKFTVIISMLAISFHTNAQQNVDRGVTMTLEMKPVLQLDMVSSDRIDFVFDEKSKFYSGITQKGATVLKVTATTKWDLYAVGRSKGKSPNGTSFWDQEASYNNTMNSVADIPLSLLEIKQNHVNPAGKNATAHYADYSQDFAAPYAPNGGNSLYVSNNGTPTPPTNKGKYIAGHSGTAESDNSSYMPSGSFASNKGIDPNFYFEIDYRILPGYPAVFPNAFNADATIAENLVANANANTVLAGGIAGSGNNSYAEPGEYIMYVQYVLLEDQ